MSDNNETWQEYSLGQELFKATKKLVMSSALSDYDVISNFGSLILRLVPWKMRFFVTFLFLNQLSSNWVHAGTQNWILIHIANSKSGFRDDFGQYGAKAIILRRFLAFFWPNAYLK